MQARERSGGGWWWRPAAALVLVVGVAIGIVASARAASLSVCPTSCSFTTIQAAINAAASGDTITVAAGTYHEQLVDTKSLTLIGAGSASTFIAPTVLALDTSGKRTILTIGGSPSVSTTISGFTITGPVAEIDQGIIVRDGATADIHDNTLKDIRESVALSGIQRGTAIWVGRWALGTTGHATITHNVITGYQKSGIVVDNVGSSAVITGNTVTGEGPTTVIAQNAIQIGRGATATVSGNTFSANSYTGIQPASSTGILLYGPGAATIGSNVLNGNDIGLDTDTQSTLGSIDLAGLSGSGNGQFAVAETTGWTTPTATYANVGSSATGGALVSAGGQVYVSGFSAFTTIQDAVDHVAIGGTVAVASGTYPASLTITKGVTIEGAGATITGPITIVAGGVTIHGFTLTGQVTAGGTAQLDAVHNWWGSAIAADVLSRAGANVNATPWCTDSACATLSNSVALTGLSVPGVGSTSVSSSTTSYGLDVGNDVSSASVVATATPGATVAISGAGGLSVGGNTVTITVTAADGTASKAYKLDLRRAAARSTGGGGGIASVAAPAEPVLNAPASSSATLERAGTLTVVVAQLRSAAGGGGTASAPVTVSVHWPANAFSAQVTVLLTPIGQLSALSGGTMTTPGAAFPVGGGFVLGDALVMLTVTDANGRAVTTFAAPLVIHVSAGYTGETPAYSHDGVTWTTIPRLPGTGLSGGRQDGYVANADGTIDIDTLHATYFGILADIEAPSVPILSAQLFGRTVHFAWHGAKDNGRVTGYQVIVNGRATAVTARTVQTIAARAGRYQVVALDAGGNVGKRSATITVSTRARPAGVPRLTPGWARQLLAWQIAPRAKRGARPGSAPHALPAWYPRWAKWQLQPLRLAV